MSLAKFKSKPKKIWEIINRASGVNTVRTKLSELSINGINVTNDNEMASAFNDHFTQIGNETNVDPISLMPDNPNVPEFSINNTGPVHVIDVVKSMQSKLSNDCNNISMKLVKFIIYEIAVPLAHIFQLSIETGIFPEKFKKSRVVPVYKCGDARICDNYRPIALVNTCSKILEKMVATDLYNHLDINNLIYKHQYGFQRNKSTEHNLIQVTNFIGQAINEGKWCIGIFLDLKKAFDTVQHNILLKKTKKIWC
jgi:sarcosine oxidase/L-pipecolate oxidase